MLPNGYIYILDDISGRWCGYDSFAHQPLNPAEPSDHLINSRNTTKLAREIENIWTKKNINMTPATPTTMLELFFTVTHNSLLFP